MSHEEKDKKQEYNRQYHAKHRDKLNADRRRRYALHSEREKASAIQRSKDNVIWLHEQLGNECCVCQSTTNLELDHIDITLKKPNTKPSKKEVDNLRLLCKPCHRQWSIAQNKAAWHLLKQLSQEDRTQLTQLFYEENTQ